MRTLPAAAGTLIGDSAPCLGEAGVTYAVSPIAGAASYLWTVPTGATIVSGQGTNTIQVDYALTATPGNIIVRGTNCVGIGTSSTKVIAFSTATLGTIGGESASYSVDLVTGTLRATLPLFKLSHGDISVPGYLSYSASGVHVIDDDGWVGQNWGLSVESYGIFREMRSLPDDYSQDTRRGWLFGNARTTIKNFVPTTDNTSTICSDEVANYSTLNGIGYDQDTEPDVFHVSAPGIAFDFYFDENRVPQVVPLNDVVITPYTAAGAFTTSTTAGPITSFIVTDQKGVQYTFNEVETTTENMYNADKFYFVRRSNMHVTPFTYNTSWKLKKIVSPVYGIIDLEYTPITFSPSDLEMTSGMKAYIKFFQTQTGPTFTALTFFYRYPLITSNLYNAGSNLAYQKTSTIKVLNKIAAATGEVEFISAPKNAGTLRQRLGSIKVTDKRDGIAKTVREIVFNYSQNGERALLGAVVEKLGCYDLKYGFEYLNNGFPPYDSKNKDEWNFYKIKNLVPGTLQYDESAPAMTLSKIIHPNKGYSAFFYETNDFWDGSANVQGGGIRIKKIINYDGVSTGDEATQEYEYKAVNGNSSGKLQHKAGLSISVARHYIPGYDQSGIWYKQFQAANPSLPTAKLNEAFSVQSDQDMSTPTLLNGSFVGYERVTVNTVNGGKMVYEYDLPTSYNETTANNGEWTASRVMIARPSTGVAGACFEIPNIDEGYYRYPFPVQSNYDFARGRLLKATGYNDAGVKVSDVVYEYQRIYPVGQSSITKIYGLTLEELPTYYYNSSNAYVTGKMFLYSRYAIFANVDVVLKKETNTIYYSADELVKNQEITTYNYNSTKHSMLSEVITQNSDGSQSRRNFTYSSDYTVTSASGTEAVALANLAAAHRIELIEKRSSRTISGVEKTTEANLITYQTISGKLYPYKAFSFVSVDGSTAFSPSMISGSTFQFDQTDYVLDNTQLSFDTYGNVTEVKGRNRTVSGALYGFMGQLPVFTFSNARLGELMYHDFDDIVSPNTIFVWGPLSYTTGRNGSRALNLPAGSSSTNRLMSTFTNNLTQNYILSFWAKAATAGTLSIKVSPGTFTTFTKPFTTSADFKYYSFKVPVSTVIGNGSGFEMELWSSNGIIVDELAFYPEQADFKTTAYEIPEGVVCETDSRGNSVYYDSDLWGRLKTVYDQDKNVRTKYNYQTRP